MILFQVGSVYVPMKAKDLEILITGRNGNIIDFVSRGGRVLDSRCTFFITGDPVEKVSVIEKDKFYQLEADSIFGRENIDSAIRDIDKSIRDIIC